MPRRYFVCITNNKGLIKTYNIQKASNNILYASSTLRITNKNLIYIQKSLKQYLCASSTTKN